MNDSTALAQSLSNPAGEPWEASWIWGGEEASPRNEWRCFRRQFELPEEAGDEGLLSITADSRFVLYVNGTRVGRGPNRSWPFEQSCDHFDVAHLLVPGTVNTIAVLVMHYGISTFSYRYGRGGLLAQLDVRRQGRRFFSVATDESWETALYDGYERNASRMSCQLAFTERVDARNWADDWMRSGSPSHGAWKPADVIGRPGMEPWTSIVPADIPPLTEEPLWPVRVESLKRVKPISQTYFLDVRTMMVPESVRHANHIGYAGYVATVVRVPVEADMTIGLPTETFALTGLGVYGVYYAKEALFDPRPECYLKVRLHAGDNLVWLKFAGLDHGHGIHIGFDCETAFELISPCGDESEGLSPFAVVGPFAAVERIDHQEHDSPLLQYAGFGGDKALDQEAFPDFAAFQSFAERVSRPEDLDAYATWTRPAPAALVGLDSVFALSVWKKGEEEFPVPLTLQNMVIPNASPAVIPVYNGHDTEVLIDFGRELSGYLQFEVDAPAGTVLDWYGFEYMRDGWRQETYGLDNTLRYTCREGRQRYESIVRRGLRYVVLTVRGASRPVKLFGVQLVQSHYPVAEIGRFHSSDAKLNQIWEISKHTTRLCMEDTFVDCPAYEQTFWVGDSRNEALVNYYVFGATDIVKRCLKLVPGSRFQTPLYADQVPSGWSSVIPNWTFFWALACEEYAAHTGDREFAVSMWPHVRFTLEHYLQKLDDRGLLFIKGWNLLDWAPIDQPNDGVVTHQNAVLVLTLHAAAKLAKAAGLAEEGEPFAAAGAKLKLAMNEHLWSDEKMAYMDCIHADGRRSVIYSMQTQVIAYLCGIADGGRKRTLEAYLQEPPASFVPIGSPFMSFFYYEALAKLGQFDLMLSDIRKHYGQMIEYEATTCWEMYPGFNNFVVDERMPTRSHCHAWSAAPAYFMGAYVLGVRPAEEGWKRVLIAPQTAHLEWARGTVPLPQGGRVDVIWRITGDGGFDLAVRAPRDIEVDVELPPEYPQGSCRIDRF